MEVPWRDRRPAPRAVPIAVAVTAALTAIAIVTIDQPLARWIAEYEPATFWNRVLDVLEWTLGLPFFKLFSSVVLVALMLATVANPRWRGHAPVFIVLAGTHVISRFLTNQLKDLTGRIRPKEWLKLGGDETFGFEGGVAFPSGHVTLFASILIPLAIVAPRTRPLLVIVAYVMIARIAVNGHWVSDTIGSITLVALVAWGLSWLVRPFRTA